MPSSHGPLRISSERIVAIGDAIRATFGFPAALAMIAGLILGLGLPGVDEWLDITVPLFVFSTQDAARSMLETVATATVAVAGISVSVTIVAFTLSANQLSPRVLRSFRRDLISQLTLAAFLGTFIYCLGVLVRLGSLGPGRVPTLSIAVAVFLALIAFALFAAFIGHIANMLQPSSIIASIAGDARVVFEHPYPAGVGMEPDDDAAARAETEKMKKIAEPIAICSKDEGFLIVVHGGAIVDLAEKLDLLVHQSVAVGSYVLPGQTLAEVWNLGSAPESAAEEQLAPYFVLGSQRTLPQDPAFPVRQLADVALKGLSPGINDPTTACNAVEAMSAGLVRFARTRPPGRIRLDEGGRPRLVAEIAEFDQLVALGFEQVCLYARSDPVVLAKLRDLLCSLRGVAAKERLAHLEVDRLLDSVGGQS